MATLAVVSRKLPCNRTNAVVVEVEVNSYQLALSVQTNDVASLACVNAGNVQKGDILARDALSFPHSGHPFVL